MGNEPEELEVFSEHEFELMLLRACAERAGNMLNRPATIRECERVFLDELLDLVDTLYRFDAEKWKRTLEQPCFYVTEYIMLVRDIALKMFTKPDPYGE